MNSHMPIYKTWENSKWYEIEVEVALSRIYQNLYVNVSQINTMKSLFYVRKILIMRVIK